MQKIQVSSTVQQHTTQQNNLPWCGCYAVIFLDETPKHVNGVWLEVHLKTHTIKTRKRDWFTSSYSDNYSTRQETHVYI